MSVIERTGSFGKYYGSPYDSSNSLTYEQMEVNASYIYSYLDSKGWSVNAISAILGNMHVESSMNPGRWQSDRVAGDPTSHGYSLVQWTPYTKYIEWCDSAGYNDPSEMDTALARIIYEIENNIQWIGIAKYGFMSFKDFSKSNDDVGLLTKAFMQCYERPLDQSDEALNTRASYGEGWYTFLTGIVPNPPSPGASNKKKNKKFKFILFKRRLIRG